MSLCRSAIVQQPKYAPLVLGWAVIGVYIALHVAFALQHCKLHTLLVHLVAVTVNGLHAVKNCCISIMLQTLLVHLVAVTVNRLHAVKICCISIMLQTLLVHLVAVTVNGLHAVKNFCSSIMLFLQLSKDIYG